MKRISMVSVIDDDDLFQFIIHKLLESSNVIDSILPFPNGKEALDYFLENGSYAHLLPDLVFLDLKMPVMNGWKFLDNLSKAPIVKKNISIYVCTSSVNPRDQEMYKHFSNLSGYLIKPITKDEIFETLDNVLTIY